MGIEPTLPAWKAGTLPLSYTRVGSVPPGPLDPKIEDARRGCWLGGGPGRSPSFSLGAFASFWAALSVHDPAGRTGAVGGAGFEPAKA